VKKAQGKRAAAPRRPAALSLKLLAAFAHDARELAHAPFSNASYGLTLCAERTAIFKAVSEGIRKFETIAIVADARGSIAAPCGACRQIIWEFCGDVWVHMADLRGRSRTVRMSELLPYPFDRSNL
jgi:cytidine deaminase